MVHLWNLLSSSAVHPREPFEPAPQNPSETPVAFSAVDDKVQVVKMELCEDVEDGFHGLEVF